jgi:exopolysaccharide production protein ExoQ
VSTVSSMPHTLQAPARSQGVRLRISPEQRDFLVFALWCCVTFVQFRGDQFLLYPLALYYAWAIWRDQAMIVPLMAKSWALLLFPIWCLISPLWAVNPEAALKQAIYLILTMMICYQVAATLSPRRIVHAVLVAAGVIGVLNASYAFASGDLRTGIFVQKNYMGKYMVLFWVVGLAVVVDRGSAGWIRIGAAGLAVISAVMAYLSESATAVLLILVTSVIILGGVIFLLGGAMRASRISAFCLCIAGAASIGAFVLPSLQTSPIEAVLGHFGKDTTLTGRTVLWSYAEDQIAQRPLLGVGAEGFWRYDASPLVQKIFEDFYKGPRDSFNFHNSYYEIAVHQGLIGLSLAVFALVWGLYHIIRGAFLLGTLPQIYFLTHTLAVLARTLTEADFFQAFTLFHMVFWIGALSVVRITQMRATVAGRTHM